MPDLSAALPFMLCVALLALIAGIVMWVVRADRRRKQEKRARAAALGFQPVDAPDPALVEKLYALHMRRGRKLQLRSLFYRRAADYDLYLFDLWDTGGESSSALIENGALVISPHLRLPPMMLYSKIEGSGFLTQAANQMITRAFMGQNRLEFPGEPEFERHFWVTSPEEAAARAFLRPDLLRRVDTLKNVHLAAGGDAFTLSPAVQGGYVYSSGPGLEQEIARTIQDAERVARWFFE